MTTLPSELDPLNSADITGLLPVITAPGETARDAGPSEGRGAGVVTHVVPLRGAHTTALHVTPADAQAREASDARSIAEAGVVEPGLCHRGRVSGRKKTTF